MSIRPLKWILLTPVLALLLSGHGFGAKWQNPPGGLPDQMQSQVNYDPELSDPFFESERWRCPNNKEECDDKDRLKNTARCFTSFQYDHFIHVCDAKFVDANTIELFIHEATASTYDNLRIIIRNGVFRTQYWTDNVESTPLDEGLRWTTTKQKLTLDKTVYRKGDVIKGRIVFECAEEVNNPLPGAQFPHIIKIEGVFKTILE